jgi:hypothetical protein
MCIACELAMMDMLDYVEGKKKVLADDTLKFAIDTPDTEKTKQPQQPKAEESKP